MTYPPQPPQTPPSGQPGPPGGWDPQAASGPYSPQPQYNQPPYNPAQPPYDQGQSQGQPPQYDPWATPPGGQPYGAQAPVPPPKKKRTGLIVGIVIAAVVVIGGGIAAAVLLVGNSGGRGLATPEALQSAAVDAYNAKDAKKFDPLWCEAPPQSQLDDLQSKLAQIPQGVTYSSAKPPSISGDSGTLTLQAQAGSTGAAKSFPLPIKQIGGSWCLG